ncbi:MAG: PAS domain-containing protein [Ferrovibrio sp.]|uniref:PAS domain-containing protein n=1 Tax=Ferrovibrio sp. TaxID=1917215 RepID=UPI0026106DBA|nr:PAS domain-containing protein [Ferrovibrio sp.]MCW0232065.1 PAS domain-containing protein [Ferrovibrio sp.]
MKPAFSAGRRLLARDGQSLTADIEGAFIHERLRAFVALWQVVIPAEHRIPSRSDMPPELLRDFLPYLVIIDMDESRQRYRFRLVGTEVVAMNGRDGTGKWLDELYSPVDMQAHHKLHQQVIANGRPVRIHGTLGFVDRSFITLEGAIVPLSRDIPDRVEQFMLCLAYGDLQQPG